MNIAAVCLGNMEGEDVAVTARFIVQAKKAKISGSKPRCPAARVMRTYPHMDNINTP